MDIALDPFPFAGGTTTFDPSFTGGVRVGVADYSSDGTLDILAGSSVGAGGTMNVFNYETLDLIDSLSISDSTQAPMWPATSAGAILAPSPLGGGGSSPRIIPLVFQGLSALGAERSQGSRARTDYPPGC